VVPRVPVKVRFDPANLLNSLNILGDNEHRMKCDDVLDFFINRDYKLLPLEIVGNMDNINRQDFAEAMLDRIRARFGTFIPSPIEPVVPHFLLPAPEQISSGSFEWDLNEAIVVSRTVVFQLSPFDAAREMVNANGIASVYHETTVPPLPLGIFSISILGNFYPYRPNVEAIGVTLRAAPCPPRRFQTVTKTVELKPPSDEAIITLKLSPTEKLEYYYSIYVVLRTAKGIVQLNGATIQYKEEHLYINSDDLPVEFFPIEATSSLLELANITGICRWESNGIVDEQSFDLNLQQSSLALAFPRESTIVTVEIEAQEIGGDQFLKLEPITTPSLMLDLFSFAEYGSHQIDIECIFGDLTNTYVIELLPEGRPELKEEISIQFFTPKEPRKIWTWFSESPFHAGYRYRSKAGTDNVPVAWSETLPAFESLKIEAATGKII